MKLRHSFIIIFVTALFTALLYVFEGSSPEIRIKLFLLCTALGLLMFRLYLGCQEEFSRNFWAFPVFISSYLLSGIMLCFPNRVVLGLSLFLAASIVLTSIIGLPMGLGFLAGFFCLRAVIIQAPLTPAELLQPFLLLLCCISISGRYRTKTAGSGFFISLSCQMLLLILTELQQGNQFSFWGNLLFFAVSNGLAGWFLIHKQPPAAEIELSVEPFELHRLEPERPPVPEAETGMEPMEFSGCTLEELCDTAFPLQQLMKEKSFKAFERALETADFVRKIAEKTELNQLLCYAAALYQDIDRLSLKSESEDETSASEELLSAIDCFPEQLQKIIQEQKCKEQMPDSAESMLVMITVNLFKMYYYVIKNEKPISIKKLINNTFQMYLKKGIIKSTGISMSLYHKIWQEFVTEFLHDMNIIEEDSAENGII